MSLFRKGARDPIIYILWGCFLIDIVALFGKGAWPIYIYILYCICDDRLSHFGEVFLCCNLYIGCPKQWFFGWYWCNWSMICFLNNCPHRKVHQKKLGCCRTFCVKVHVAFSKESPPKRPKKDFGMHAFWRGVPKKRFFGFCRTFGESSHQKNGFLGTVALFSLCFLEKVPTKKTVFWVLSHFFHCDRFLEKVPYKTKVFWVLSHFLQL